MASLDLYAKGDGNKWNENDGSQELNMAPFQVKFRHFSQTFHMNSIKPGTSYKRERECVPKKESK